MTVVEHIGEVGGRAGSVDRNGYATVVPDGIEGVDPSLSVLAEDDGLRSNVIAEARVTMAVKIWYLCLLNLREHSDALQHLREADIAVASDDGGLVEIFDHSVFSLLHV